MDVVQKAATPSTEQTNTQSTALQPFVQRPIHYTLIPTAPQQYDIQTANRYIK